MRGAVVLLLACVCLAGELHAQAAPRARIYGVEVDASPARDRVLVFADGPVRPRLQEVDRGTLMLVFPGAELDPSAPTSLSPDPEGAVKRVTVFETAGDEPEVRVTILRTAGVSPRLSRRGSQVALDFARPGAPPATRRSRRDEAPAPAERTLEARWLNIGTADAIERLARFVGMRLILDQTLTGSVSIDAPKPLRESEARAMIDALLLLKGFGAVLGPGDTRKVLPIRDAPGPWVEGLEQDPGEVPLVTLIRLTDIDAELVLQAITPLVGDHGIAQLHEPSNGILLAGAGNRLRRLADVMQSLDDEGLRQLVLIPLRYAHAADTSEALLDALGSRGSQLQVWPDERTNRLIVRGRPDVVERARGFVDRIDRPAEGRGEIQVLPVRYMDAERLAENLLQLAGQEVTSGVRGAASLAGREFAVSVHQPTHSLVVRADPETISIVRDLVAEIDREPRRVDVELTVSEVSHLDTMSIALDALIPVVEPDDLNDLLIAVAANPGGNLLSTATNAGLFARVAQTPLLIPIVNPITGLPDELLIPRATGVLTADDQQLHSRVLLRPRLSMLSGEEHEIFSGENIPVPTAEVGDTAGNPLQVRQTIERHDTGVRLRVQPTVPEDGPIVLELDVEVSRFAGLLQENPVFQERTLEATIRLRPGLTAVVGWVSLPSRGYRVIGTPFLKDIPFFGALFRRTDELSLSTHLLIAVRAERDRPEAVVLTRWLLRELAERESDFETSYAPAVSGAAP